MTRIIEDNEAHYETREVPFGRLYEWHPEHIIVECDCGERFTLSATSTTPTCRCGIDHGAIVRNIERHADSQSDKISHPWLYDAQEQAEQHHRDESAYPEGSPWRYNDVTAGLGDERRSSNAGPLHPLLRKGKKGKTNAR
jgi:hypothetical protein